MQICFKIEEKGYATLQEAFDAVKGTKATILQTKDYVIDNAELSGDENTKVVLDMDNHIITSKIFNYHGAIQVVSCKEFTLKNGTVISTYEKGSQAGGIVYLQDVDKLSVENTVIQGYGDSLYLADIKSAQLINNRVYSFASAKKERRVCTGSALTLSGTSVIAKIDGGEYSLIDKATGSARTPLSEVSAVRTCGKIAHIELMGNCKFGGILNSDSKK